jgi:hypothetical protein
VIVAGSLKANTTGLWQCPGKFDKPIMVASRIGHTKRSTSAFAAINHHNIKILGYINSDPALNRGNIFTVSHGSAPFLMVSQSQG